MPDRNLSDHPEREWPTQEEVLARLEKLADELQSTGRKPTEFESYYLKHLVYHIAEVRDEKVRPTVQSAIDGIRSRLGL